MASEAAARIAEADAKAFRAQYAYQTGRFAEYFKAEYTAAEKAITDEFERITGGPPTTGGDGKTDG